MLRSTTNFMACEAAFNLRIFALIFLLRKDRTERVKEDDAEDRAGRDRHNPGNDNVSDRVEVDRTNATRKTHTQNCPHNHVCGRNW